MKKVLTRAAVMIKRLRPISWNATNTMLKYNAAYYMHNALHKHMYVAAKHKEQDNNDEDKQNAVAD